MKNIIKSLLVLGVCVAGAKANAQLASERPAMTQAQIATLQKNTVVPASSNVQTASASATQVQPQRKIETPSDVVKAAAAIATQVPAKIPQVPMQTEKPKENN